LLEKKFKAKIKALAEEIFEKYGYNSTEVAKIKKVEEVVVFDFKSSEVKINVNLWLF
jgi:hypothetical protein